MAHILILREAPSFIQGENLIYGTHEIIENNITKRAYKFNAARKGYTIATSSEFKLVWYRLKKEAIEDFLQDLGIINLNPAKLPKGFWKSLLVPKFLIRDKYSIVKSFGFGRLGLLLLLFFKLIPLLKGADMSNKIPDRFNVDNKNKFWGYNFFLGYIEDIDKGMGEEL